MRDAESMLFLLNVLLYFFICIADIVRYKVFRLEKPVTSTMYADNVVILDNKQLGEKRNDMHVTEAKTTVVKVSVHNGKNNDNTFDFDQSDATFKRNDGTAIGQLPNSSIANSYKVSCIDQQNAGYAL